MTKSERLFRQAAAQLAANNCVTVDAIIAACNRAVEAGCNDEDDAILSDVYDLMIVRDDTEPPVFPIAPEGKST
jgi:hypothetical protein